MLADGDTCRDFQLRFQHNIWPCLSVSFNVGKDCRCPSRTREIMMKPQHNHNTCHWQKVSDQQLNNSIALPCVCACTHCCYKSHIHFRHRLTQKTNHYTSNSFFLQCHKFRFVKRLEAHLANSYVTQRFVCIPDLH